MKLTDLVLAAPFNKYLIEVGCKGKTTVIESDTPTISIKDCWCALRNAGHISGSRPKNATPTQRRLLVRPDTAKQVL